jgi:hypothetical protein
LCEAALKANASTISSIPSMSSKPDDQRQRAGHHLDTWLQRQHLRMTCSA